MRTCRKPKSRGEDGHGWVLLGAGTLGLEGTGLREPQDGPEREADTWREARGAGLGETQPCTQLCVLLGDLGVHDVSEHQFPHPWDVWLAQLICDISF